MADASERPDSPEPPDADTADEDGDKSVQALRREVEQKYDFEEFGPADMAEMSAEEWEVAFDPETWITGQELLDRVEADLKHRIATRDVFARIERFDESIIAYSDTGYATIYADGSVEGQGTVLRDVKPTVALCSMESYDVPEEPPDETLPEPREVPEGSGDFGNLMLQVVAAVQVLAGVGLLAASVLVFADVIQPPGGESAGSLNVFVMIAGGIAFLLIGIFLFVVVANARLSDKFRAEEYRNRLRAIDLEAGERPDFLPEDVTIEQLAAGGSGEGGVDADGSGDGSVDADGSGDGSVDADGSGDDGDTRDEADETTDDSPENSGRGG